MLGCPNVSDLGSKASTSYYIKRLVFKKIFKKVLKNLIKKVNTITLEVIRGADKGEWYICPTAKTRNLEDASDRGEYGSPSEHYRWENDLSRKTCLAWDDDSTSQTSLEPRIH